MTQETGGRLDERARPIALAEAMAWRWERLARLYGESPSAALDERHKALVLRAVRGELLPTDPRVQWR